MNIIDFVHIGGKSPPTTKLNVSLVFSTLNTPCCIPPVAPACMEKFLYQLKKQVRPASESELPASFPRKYILQIEQAITLQRKYEQLGQRFHDIGRVIPHHSQPTPGGKRVSASLKHL